jgi:hypothetical protein
MNVPTTSLPLAGLLLVHPAFPIARGGDQSQECREPSGSESPVCGLGTAIQPGGFYASGQTLVLGVPVGERRARAHKSKSGPIDSPGFRPGSRRAKTADCVSEYRRSPRRLVGPPNAPKALSARGFFEIGMKVGLTGRTGRLASIDDAEVDGGGAVEGTRPTLF